VTGRDPTSVAFGAQMVVEVQVDGLDVFEMSTPIDGLDGDDTQVEASPSFSSFAT